MHLPSWPRIGRNARRLTEILTVLTKYGLADMLGGLIDLKPSEKQTILEALKVRERLDRVI